MACLFLMSAVFFADTINIFGKIWKGRADFNPARVSGWWRRLLVIQDEERQPPGCLSCRAEN
jgi:hypothetical protein